MKGIGKKIKKKKKNKKKKQLAAVKVEESIAAPNQHDEIQAVPLPSVSTKIVTKEGKSRD